jgi:hypothetical protein
MEDPYYEFHVAHPLYKKGVEQEYERIWKILMDRTIEVEEIAKSLGNNDNVDTWPTYVQAVYFEIHKILELIEPGAE